MEFEKQIKQEAEKILQNLDFEAEKIIIEKDGASVKLKDKKAVFVVGLICGNLKEILTAIGINTSLIWIIQKTCCKSMYKKIATRSTLPFLHLLTN